MVAIARSRRDVSPAPSRRDVSPATSPVRRRVRERRPSRSNPRAPSPLRARPEEARAAPRESATRRLATSLARATQTKTGRALVVSVLAWVWLTQVAPRLLAEWSSTLVNAALCGVVVRAALTD